MKVLLSIKPEYVEKILYSNKKYEFRRSIWKRKIKEVLVYSSSPVQRIGMSFKVDNIIEGSPKFLWDKYHEYSGMSRDDFFKYFKNCDTGYAIEIGNIKKFEPYKLNARPPQSYMYIHE
jgi:predicted transcriptional regulator